MTIASSEVKVGLGDKTTAMVVCNSHNVSQVCIECK